MNAGFESINNSYQRPARWLKLKKKKESAQMNKEKVLITQKTPPAVRKLIIDKVLKNDKPKLSDSNIIENAYEASTDFNWPTSKVNSDTDIDMKPQKFWLGPAMPPVIRLKKRKTDTNVFGNNSVSLAQNLLYL